MIWCPLLLPLLPWPCLPDVLSLLACANPPPSPPLPFFLAACCDADGNWVQEALQPPFSPEEEADGTRSYNALLQYSPLWYAKQRLMLSRQRLTDVIIVAWSDCEVLQGQQAQQSGGPTSLLLALDLTGQASRCTVILLEFVASELGPVSPVEFPDATAGSQNVSEASSATTTNASLPVTGGNVRTRLLMSKTKTKAKSVSKASSPPPPRRAPVGGGTTLAAEVQHNPSVSIASGTGLQLEAATPSSYSQGAQYIVTIVPLSDPETMSMLSMTFMASLPGGNSTEGSDTSQLLVLCGIPKALSAAFPSLLQSSGPSPPSSPQSQSSSDPTTTRTLLANAIRGNISAAKQLRLLLASSGTTVTLDGILVDPSGNVTYQSLAMTRTEQPQPLAALSPGFVKGGGNATVQQQQQRVQQMQLIVNPYYQPLCGSDVVTLVHAPLLSRMPLDAALLAEPAGGTGVQVEDEGERVAGMVQAAVLMEAGIRGVPAAGSGCTQDTLSGDNGNINALGAVAAAAVNTTGRSSEQQAVMVVDAAVLAPCRTAGVVAGAATSPQPQEAVAFPVIARAADGISSRTFTLLLFANAASMANLSALAPAVDPEAILDVGNSSVKVRLLSLSRPHA